MENYKTLLFNENYEVSDMGNVRNKRTGRILKPEVVHNGYLRVTIGKKRYRVHRLVYETFVDPIPEGYQIDHINEKRQDNRLVNLQVLTQAENVRKACNKPVHVIYKVSEGFTFEFDSNSITDASQALGRSHSYCSSVLRGIITKQSITIERVKI
ncbi:TPA: NUMOD4 motif-containing HNH endonuclease [Enterococcus faecium]|nr:hypothetical protein [Enterococcus faecium]EME7210166.1 NUMOD4 motif-containing HNH endonuclease [Enterococcus faecium]HDO7719104.1 NUMOD4 motif-containing HNH endonuclease [Enterococcus faecium]HDO7779572.1 NUMOD4 motif-containing HNH endonuclease [Enterococcus faecium]